MIDGLGASVIDILGCNRSRAVRCEVNSTPEGEDLVNRRVDFAREKSHMEDCVGAVTLSGTSSLWCSCVRPKRTSA